MLRDRVQRQLVKVIPFVPLMILDYGGLQIKLFLMTIGEEYSSSYLIELRPLNHNA